MCSLQFTIPHELDPPVFLYYRLTNFYQNHRRYVKSQDADQLKGDAVSSGTIGSSNCNPLRLDDQKKPYYPCGLIANSLFNDSFAMPLLLNVEGKNQMNQTYNMTNKGIAWDSDKVLYGRTKYKPADIAVPPNWRKQYPETGYSDENPPPNLDEYEEFQVWMRTAGLPAFSKLSMRNDKEKMACGTYQLDVIDSRSVQRAVVSSLTQARFQRYNLRRDEVSLDLYHDSHGRQESVPGYCIHCGRRYLYRPWGVVHRHPSHQAAVCRYGVFGYILAECCLSGNSATIHTLRGTMISPAPPRRVASHDQVTTPHDSDISFFLLLREALWRFWSLLRHKIWLKVHSAPLKCIRISGWAFWLE